MLAALADGVTRITRLFAGRRLRRHAGVSSARSASTIRRHDSHRRDPRPWIARPAGCRSGAARCRQLRHDDAAARRHARRASVPNRDRRGRVALAAGRCAASSSPLTRMGARVESVDGRPPLTIHGGDLHGIEYRPEVPSAQVKSAVLLAGLQSRGRTTVVEPAPTRDHTERALTAFGVTVRIAQRGRRGRGRAAPARRAPSRSPGDISCAAFWVVLAAGTSRRRDRVAGVGLNRAGWRCWTSCGAPAPRSSVDRRRRRQRRACRHPSASARRRCAASASIRRRCRQSSTRFRRWPRSARCCPEGRRWRFAARASCASRRAIASRSSRSGLRAIGASVRGIPGRLPIRGAPAGRRHRRTRPAITGWPWRSPSPRQARPAPTTIAGASAVAVSYPGFSKSCERLTRHGDDR